MRRLFATLLFISLASPLFASWWPSVSQQEIRIYVGETVPVRITPTWSGITDYGNGVHWIFRTDSQSIASGWIRMDDSRPQDLLITGIAPGFTAVRQEYPNGGVNAYPLLRVYVLSPEAPAPPARRRSVRH